MESFNAWDTVSAYIQILGCFCSRTFCLNNWLGLLLPSISIIWALYTKLNIINRIVPGLAIDLLVVLEASCMAVHFMMTSSNRNIFRVTGPLCGEFTAPGEFPAQRPVTRSFGVFFDLRLNKRLSKQPWGWWFETPAWSLWRHRNVKVCFF